MPKPVPSIPLLHHAFDTAPTARRLTAFTTQRGKTHTAEAEAYAGYNMAFHTGDTPERVAAHRALLCQTLNIELDQLIIPTQTHSLNIAKIDTTHNTLSPAQQAKALHAVDAIITDLPGIYLGVLTADCVPILLYDPEHEAIAAIHAGWRGTVGRIAAHTLTAMQQHYHTRPEAVQVAIGPSISLQAFEVGQEVYDAFAKADFHMPDIAEPFKKRWHIDLWWANAEQLQALGVPFHHIYCAGVCTIEQADTYFSARALGQNSGRMLTAIGLHDTKI